MANEKPVEMIINDDLDLDFDRHLRIGITADGDYFVQIVQIKGMKKEAVTVITQFSDCPHETIVAQAEGPTLREALKKLVISYRGWESEYPFSS
jgi:hypothetical protein